MTRKYAARTKIPTQQSRMEIEKTLKRYGASGFAYFEEGNVAAVAFKMDVRHIRMSLTLPSGDSTKDDQEARRLWRALAMIVKAKLEAVASGVSILDDEFMAHIVMPDGKTVSEHVRPRITEAYESGETPALLPSSSQP